MIKPINEIVLKLAQRPKNLFLIDAIGAMLTMILLVVILFNFNHYFGITKTTFSYLSLFVAFLIVYSATCFFFLKDNWTFYIRIISTANLLYCVLTLGLMIFNFDTLTVIGLTYFLIEITIIVGLVYIELSVANKIKKNRNVTKVKR